MFGEYLPYAEYLPDSFPLKTLCNSVNAGQGPVAFPLTVHKKNYYLLTNICFESSNPPIIANQVDQLAREGKEPDILINMSNDGWFRMTWQIDMHLATHIFRAVENRKPVLSATHAGLSAGIDPIGRITVEAARGLSGFIEASVLPIKVKRLPRWPWRLPSIILILTLVLTGYSLLPLHRPITSLPTENNECHRHSSGVLK